VNVAKPPDPLQCALTRGSYPRFSGDKEGRICSCTQSVHAKFGMPRHSKLKAEYDGGKD